jgi:transaldolase
VTTNPTHLSKEGGDPLKVVKDICALLPRGEISVEVTEEDPAAVYKQARDIAEIGQNVVVKVPCHAKYIGVISDLVADNVPLNITLVFSALQALMMAKLNVRYVSPFIGRLDDIGEDGLQLIKDIRVIFDQYAYKTDILAASTRTVENMHDVALLGADVATVSVENFEQSLQHPLTDSGMKTFLDDWKKLGVSQFP